MPALVAVVNEVDAGINGPISNFRVSGNVGALLARDVADKTIDLARKLFLPAHLSVETPWAPARCERDMIAPTILGPGSGCKVYHAIAVSWFNW